MPPLEDLLSAQAVRERCYQIGAFAEAGESRHFQYHPDHLTGCIDRVVKQCRENYPDLAIPLHSRWRHFVVDGFDLWQHYRQQRLGHLNTMEIARTAIDLVFISVILDAGAGPDWRYREPFTGAVLGRSEGLAAATIDLFFNGLGQVDKVPVVNSGSIRALDSDRLQEIFQHTVGNPLLGISGRMALLCGLAGRLDQIDIDRPGQIIDLIVAGANKGRSIEAGEVLEVVLSLFNPMWPSGLVVDGVALGDCGRYELLGAGDEGLVPFHKLSQWLTWSLIEPLSDAGVDVVALDQLTGLPEYRNGGLLLDSGVLSALDPELFNRVLEVSDEAVVEWRALTVWLLDQIADGVRSRLGMNSEQLPLGSVLQGGTWSAGRALASQLRDGQPPLRLDIDGTVF